MKYLKWLNKPSISNNARYSLLTIQVLMRVGYWIFHIISFNLSVKASSDVNSVCWSPDGRYLISGQRDGTLSVWNPKTGEEVSRIAAHSGSSIADVE